MACQDVCLDPDADMQVLAEALGAVAAGPAATFWLYADDGQWCVWREGEADDRRFGTRDEAVNFLRVAAARCSSHRLMLRAPQPCGPAKDPAGSRRQPPPARDRQRSSHRWRRRLVGWLRAIAWPADSA